jgi:Fe(3+) dicitrate transport protein
MKVYFSIVTLSVLLSGSSWAQAASEPVDEEIVLDDEDDQSPEADNYVLPDVLISYKPADIARIGGSANLIEEKDLEAFEFDDPGSVLLQAPGVYLRQEDGYGLRPNIGLRGASSDRSKKVTLMEDGILFAPAPYSAPAAYYFPMMTRISSVEVFKGPAAIAYGPNTIGGAVNLITRKIPRKLKGALDLAGGTDLYTKAHGHIGLGEAWGGALFEGVFLQSDGFKELDGGGDTGFTKAEFMLKGMLQTDPLGETFQRVDLKLGYSMEESHETYLGLTDADYEDNPERRYAASALDLMRNDRNQAELRYTLVVGEDFDLTLTGYYQTFWRSWRKLNRFRGGESLFDILASPDTGERAVYYSILAGLEDSFTDAQTLLIGDNDRTFVSQGVQLQSRYTLKQGEVTHDLKLGLRLHNDSIVRDHTEDAYLMEAAVLIPEGGQTQETTQNEGETTALAAHLMYSVEAFDLTLSPGVRTELIESSLENKLDGSTREADDQVVLLGLGAHYAVTPELGFLAGLHQGFSPVSPGQPDEVEPEQSVNYELGGRYVVPRAGTMIEVVGFFSDYSNLIGECTFSAGCSSEQLDRQYNAGEVHAKGLETVFAHRFSLGHELHVPARLSYTYTRTEFQSDFVSGNPQFGEVSVGDELPYVPQHQLSFQVGVDHKLWGVGVNGTYVSAMREEAGQGDDEISTDDLFMVDALARYRPYEQIEVYLKSENLTQARPVVSRHPFGARPGKPFMVMAGLKLKL